MTLALEIGSSLVDTFGIFAEETLEKPRKGIDRFCHGAHLRRCGSIQPGSGVGRDNQACFVGGAQQQRCEVGAGNPGGEKAGRSADSEHEQEGEGASGIE